MLAIGGPTASGKSSFAVSLAKDLAGEVVCVDSVQVYKGLDIGSAKITQAEMQGVPHHLLSIREPSELFHAGEFKREADLAIADIETRNCLPIVCAGTGLYLTMLLHGMADAPNRDQALRDSLEMQSNEELLAQLEKLDPEYLKQVHKNDRHRIVRAIEIAQQSGKTYSQVLAEHSYSTVLRPALILVLCRTRQDLYRAIGQRAEQMVKSGLLSEVSDLLKKYGQNLPALSTIGYFEACRCLSGQLSEDKLATEIAQATRRLAKRQMTYWRNEPKKRGWSVRPTPVERALELEETIVRRRQPPIRSFRVLDLCYAELLQQVKSKINAGLIGVEVWYVQANQVCAI